MPFEARHISISIACPWQDVYRFAVNPANLPKWAAGLSGSIEHVDGEWVAQSPLGRVIVKFAEQNPWGILDHDVTLSSGMTVTNPMRVFANDRGSEIVFSLIRRPGTTDEAFENDARMVAEDLQTLKGLMEG